MDQSQRDCVVDVLSSIECGIRGFVTHLRFALRPGVTPISRTGTDSEGEVGLRLLGSSGDRRDSGGAEVSGELVAEFLVLGPQPLISSR